MTYGELPEVPDPEMLDYDNAESVISNVASQLSWLRQETADPKENARLLRKIQQYHREKGRLGMRPSAYQRTRKFHQVLLQMLYDGSAIENGKLKRPFHYGKTSNSTIQPT